jgi:hypothetical protein
MLSSSEADTRTGRGRHPKWTRGPDVGTIRFCGAPATPDRETLRRRAAHAGPIDEDTLVYRIEFHAVAED